MPFFNWNNYNILLGLQRRNRCFNTPQQILKLATTSKSSSTETEDIPQENAPMTKSTITTLSDMDIDAPSLAWEEAEPPPPPPPPQQQWSPSPLPPPEKPEKKPQLTGWTTRFGHLPSPEVVVVDFVKGDSPKVTAFFAWCITFSFGEL